MAIKIPRVIIAEMITHALQDDPNESCGFLFGKGDSVTRSFRVANADEDKVHRYSMDPHGVMEALQDADSTSEDVVAIYHSHTFTQAHPSETDVEKATDNTLWGDVYYVLVSLVEKTRPVVRAFRIHSDKRVEEVVITTDGVPYRGARG